MSKFCKYIGVLVLGAMFYALSSEAGAAEPTSDMSNKSSLPQEQSRANCSKSTVTGTQFLKMVHDIVMHGDLKDVPFMEQTLHVKFKIDRHDLADAKGRSYKRNVYTVNSIQGLPILVNGSFDSGREYQSKGDWIARLDFDNSSTLHDCLGIMPSDFEIEFGKKFQEIPVNDGPGMGGGADFSGVGNHGSKMYVGYSNGQYHKGDKTIDGITIAQKP
jgi:hypothetical protein